jgi:hypothetical protein
MQALKIRHDETTLQIVILWKFSYKLESRRVSPCLQWHERTGERASNNYLKSNVRPMFRHDDVASLAHYP